MTVKVFGLNLLLIGNPNPLKATLIPPLFPHKVFSSLENGTPEALATWRRLSSGQGFGPR